MDLLLPPAFKADPPKLEIKKDLKGMVTVAGATIVEVNKTYLMIGDTSLLSLKIKGKSEIHLLESCLGLLLMCRSPALRSFSRRLRLDNSGVTSRRPT